MAYMKVQKFGCWTSSWRSLHQQYSTEGWPPNTRIKKKCHPSEKPERYQRTHKLSIIDSTPTPRLKIMQMQNMRGPCSLSHQTSSIAICRETDCQGDEKYDPNAILMKGLKRSIRQGMRGYWNSKKSASLHDLAFHATSLLKLHGGQQGSLHSQIGVNAQNQPPRWQISDQSVNLITLSESELFIFD